MIKVKNDVNVRSIGLSFIQIEKKNSKIFSKNILTFIVLMLFQMSSTFQQEQMPLILFNFSTLLYENCYE